MTKIKRIIISRRTITWTIAVMVLEFFAGTLLPQRFMTAPGEMASWYGAHPVLRQIAFYLGLDHIYTSPLFALTLSVFSISLIVSSFDQFVLAWNRVFVARPKAAPAVAPGGRIVSDDDGAIFAGLRAKGYLLTFRDETMVRFVKHPWGYWGKFLLHCGIVVVIGSSLSIVLTTKRGQLNLYEFGDVYLAGTPLAKDEVGLLADRFVLPMSVRLVSFVPEFWETDNVKQLTSTVEFAEADGTVREYRLSVNSGLVYKGMKIYQSSQFGRVFFVDFIGPDRVRHHVPLTIPHPLSREEAGYRDSVLPWLLPSLHSKYYADAGKEAMISDDPLLVLRLVFGKEVLDERALRPGESGQLGEYTVRLTRTEEWAGIIFVKSFGMGGVFLGFFVIVLGGVLIYFTVPRQVVLHRVEHGYDYFCTASHFAGLYEEEFAEIGKIFSEIGAGAPGKGQEVNG